MSEVESGQVSVPQMRKAIKGFMQSYPGSLSKSVGTAVSNFRRNITSGKVPEAERGMVTEAVAAYDAALKTFTEHAKLGQSWTQPVMAEGVSTLLANASALEAVAREVQSKWVEYKGRRTASQRTAQVASRAVDREKEKLTQGYRSRGVYQNFCSFLRNCGYVWTEGDDAYKPTAEPQDSTDANIDWTAPHWFHNEEDEEGGTF